MANGNFYGLGLEVTYIISSHVPFLQNQSYLIAVETGKQNLALCVWVCVSMKERKQQVNSKPVSLPKSEPPTAMDLSKIAEDPTK